MSKDDSQESVVGEIRNQDRRISGALKEVVCHRNRSVEEKKSLHECIIFYLDMGLKLIRHCLRDKSQD